MPNRFRRLFAPPIFEDEEKTHLAQILNGFVWSAIGILLAIVIFRLIVWAENGVAPFLILLTVILTLAGIHMLIHRGYLRGASILLVWASWTGMTYQAWNADGIRDVGVIAYLLILLLASSLLGWRAGLFVGAISAALLWFFAFQEALGFRVQHIDTPLDIAIDLTTIFALAGALIYFLINSLNRSLNKTRLELKERLRAEEKLQRQADYFSALNETALGLLNHPELQPLLESILTRACDLLNTQHGLIDLVLPDGSALRQDVGHGVLSKYNGFITSKNQGITGSVWASTQPLVIQDYRTWNNSLPEFIEAGFNAVMGVPLKVGNTVIGVLVISYVEPERTFTQEQVNLMEQFAALAALAIDNARLYEMAQKELQERRNTESALRSSEERFRKVFNNNYVAITIVTLEDGIFLEANDAFWRLSGLQPEKALGHTSLELNLWDDSQQRSKFVQELLEKRSLQNVHVEFKNKDQPNKTSIAFYELIYIQDQLCILCMFYDISEQRQAERALKESEERFRKVFHASPVAICITALEDGRLLDANDAYWRLSGYDPKTDIGKSAQELYMWNSMEERRQFVTELKSKYSVFNPSYEFFDTAHNRRHVLAFYELIEIKEQPCVLSMFSDITEREESQSALRSAEARTRAILASVPDMIFEISKDGTFLDFMASAEIAPLMPPSQFLGRNIKELFPPAIAEQTLFALGRALATGQVHAFEYGLPPAEEIQFFEARVSAISPESAIIMVRDISQQKYVQTEREKLINELENKNSELERFTYTVSHDLKSPLITIKGFLGFLEQDAASGNITRLRTDMKRISDATDKMQLLLNELLELSRIGRLTNPYQDIGFEELAREVVEFLHGRLYEKKIIVDVQENLPMVHGDRQRLSEALQNLIDNAAKFTGAQSQPRIEIGQNGFENDKPIFYVKDNGQGIDVIHQDRIFGLFNKLDIDSEGTGIGLALVKRIIEVHGGRIWVHSQAGAGSTFFFTLPTAPES